ncbi:hypothetical protein DFA_06603 [Cavenderia fasciculata]|uniref:Uncharacterized protein n=1 Tax=Cavenderia fasciculata TaxID=261658 RepID=F4PJG7_CACFS|nr:uncharacterized protein DFA_06603 [Cavenderia fasciculata]EGG24453.1 hypothetical protein DFA_06603 [Cavenderia fasciculata]|eukprot:XP_004362304.1 hypothetical protein DFA_06603 [Cavenderia fasciculata]
MDNNLEDRESSEDDFLNPNKTVACTRQTMIDVTADSTKKPDEMANLSCNYKELQSLLII